MAFNTVDKRQNPYISTTSAATITGDSIDTSFAGSLQLAVSIGTNVDTAGTWTVEVYNPASAAWETYTGSASVVTAGVAHSNVWEIAPVVSEFYRLKFTRTAGTSDAVTATYTRRRGA